MDSDEWIFDTVKASTIAPRKNTTKRRKLSVIHANGQGHQAGPEDALKRLDLKDSPLEYSSPPPITVKKSTVRKQPSIVQLGSPVKHRQASTQKRPLQPDTNFGNTGSTVRLFRRVSDNSTLAQVSESAPDSIRDENRPQTTETTTKEGVLGRRVFNKVIDPAFQELHAQTGNQLKREALSRLADTWNGLDAVDPEGEFQLLKLIIDRVQSDPKLSVLLTQLKGTVRDGTPQGTPQKSSGKLVLAQINPHLASHRRRQSSMQPEGFREKLANLPGQSVPGLEHTKQLADVLYGRWTDGLRSRWPAV